MRGVPSVAQRSRIAFWRARARRAQFVERPLNANELSLRLALVALVARGRVAYCIAPGVLVVLLAVAWRLIN